MQDNSNTTLTGSIRSFAYCMLQSGLQSPPTQPEHKQSCRFERPAGCVLQKCVVCL